MSISTVWIQMRSEILLINVLSLDAKIFNTSNVQLCRNFQPEYYVYYLFIYQSKHVLGCSIEIEVPTMYVLVKN